MARALERLPREWVSAGLPGYREASGTYEWWNRDDLPPIETQLDEELSWLRAMPVIDSSLAEGDSDFDCPAPTLKEFEALPGIKDVVLPRSFRTFFASPEPQSRIRSCTACRLDPGEMVVPVKGGGSLVHFLIDQQGVVQWLLFVGKDGSEGVVASTRGWGYQRDYWGNPGKDSFDPADPGDMVVVAESFVEFLYRFRIENEIWYAQWRDTARPLTPEESRYAEHYRGGGVG